MSEVVFRAYLAIVFQFSTQANQMDDWLFG